MRLVIELATEEASAAPDCVEDKIVGLRNVLSCTRATVVLLLRDSVGKTAMDSGLWTGIQMCIPTSSTVLSQSFLHPLVGPG